MLWYADAERRERIEQFDTLVEAASEVLQDPVLVERLGDFAIELEPAVNGLFLPNERHGVLSRPHTLDEDASFALVPTHHGESLWRDSSLIAQTPRRRAMNNIVPADEQAAIPLTKVRPVMGGGHTEVAGMPGHDAFISQPVIMVKRSLATKDNRFAARAPVILHEVQHAVDYEKADSYSHVKAFASHASRELAGYHVEAVTFARSQEKGDAPLASRFIVRTALRLDLERQTHMDPDHPFGLNRKIMFYMLRQGLASGEGSMRDILRAGQCAE